MPAFTYLWTNRCRLNMLEEGYEGEPLDLSAGNAFTPRGVRKGHSIYVIAYNAGRTYLIGRMRVAKVTPRDRWIRENDFPDLWDGDEVIDGVDGTPMRFSRTLPLAVLRALRFVDGRGNEKGLPIDGTGYFDPQALRSVRRITDGTAALLDEQL